MQHTPSYRCTNHCTNLSRDTLSELVCRTSARIQLHTTPKHTTPKYASAPSACYTSIGNHALPPNFRPSRAHTRRSIHCEQIANSCRTPTNTPTAHAPVNARLAHGYAIRTCLPDQCSHPTAYLGQTRHFPICTPSQRLLHKCWQSRTSSYFQIIPNTHTNVAG